MTFRVLIVLIGLTVLSTSGITPFAERPNIPCKPRCWDTRETIVAHPRAVIIDGMEVSVDDYYRYGFPELTLFASDFGVSWLYKGPVTEGGGLNISADLR